MATTAVFAEIVVVGLETLAWLVPLLLLAVLQPPPSLTEVAAWGKSLKDWAPAVTLLMFAAAYVLGILVDRLADSMYQGFRKFFDGLWDRETPPAPVGVMRLVVMRKSEGIGRFMDYQRSRVRVARATVVNLVPATLVILLYMVLVGPPDWLLPLVGVSALGVIGLAIFVTERIHRAHEERLSEAYLMLSSRTIDDEVVAALCYRWNPPGVLQILLIRTSKGKYWTFPKGHVEKKEKDRPWKAAKREAKEEAGARGRPRKLPLAFYRYPAKTKKGMPRVDYRVAVYLLEVTEPLGHHECRRDPTWCTPKDARAKLAEGGRERVYAKEQRRVVRAAVAALGLPDKT